MMLSLSLCQVYMFLLFPPALAWRTIMTDSKLTLMLVFHGRF